MSKTGYVYILASRPKGTLYIGVTSNLINRVFQHRENAISGFTNQHGVKELVYFECFEEIEEAIRREKALKKWNRAWKIRLIEEENSAWRDLWPSLF